AGPEQALRQREHQDQDRARAGPDPDSEDRGKTAPPAAGTGEFAGLRAMGVAAMLVMDVVVVVMMVMMVMAVIMMMRGRRQHRGRPRRLQRADETAALGPDQPEPERRDQGVACDLDRL